MKTQSSRATLVTMRGHELVRTLGVVAIVHMQDTRE